MGPYSNGAKFNKLDGRTRLAKRYKAIRTKLRSMVEAPTIASEIITDGVAVRLLRVEILAKEIMENPGAADTNEKHLSAHLTAINRDLKALGALSGRVTVPTLDEILASRAAAE